VGRFDNSTATELAQIYATAFLFQEALRGFTDIASGTFTIGPYFEDLLATEVWDFFTGVGSSLGCFGKKETDPTAYLP
jgi:hypothetical protein